VRFHGSPTSASRSRPLEGRRNRIAREDQIAHQPRQHDQHRDETDPEAGRQTFPPVPAHAAEPDPDEHRQQQRSGVVARRESGSRPHAAQPAGRVSFSGIQQGCRRQQAVQHRRQVGVGPLELPEEERVRSQDDQRQPACPRARAARQRMDDPGSHHAEFEVDQLGQWHCVQRHRIQVEHLHHVRDRREEREGREPDAVGEEIPLGDGEVVDEGVPAVLGHEGGQHGVEREQRAEHQSPARQTSQPGDRSGSAPPGHPQPDTGGRHEKHQQQRLAQQVERGAGKRQVAERQAAQTEHLGNPQLPAAVPQQPLPERPSEAHHGCVEQGPPGQHHEGAPELSGQRETEHRQVQGRARPGVARQVPGQRRRRPPAEYPGSLAAQAHRVSPFQGRAGVSSEPPRPVAERWKTASLPHGCHANARSGLARSKRLESAEPRTWSGEAWRGRGWSELNSRP
jgi:hypothetical protein